MMSDVNDLYAGVTLAQPTPEELVWRYDTVRLERDKLKAEVESLRAGYSKETANQMIYELRREDENLGWNLKHSDERLDPLARRVEELQSDCDLQKAFVASRDATIATLRDEIRGLQEQLDSEREDNALLARELEDREASVDDDDEEVEDEDETVDDDDEEGDDDAGYEVMLSDVRRLSNELGEAFGLLDRADRKNMKLRGAVAGLTAVIDDLVDDD